MVNTLLPEYRYANSVRAVSNGDGSNVAMHEYATSMKSGFLSIALVRLGSWYLNHTDVLCWHSTRYQRNFAVTCTSMAESVFGVTYIHGCVCFCYCVHPWLGLFCSHVYIHGRDCFTLSLTFVAMFHLVWTKNNLVAQSCSCQRYHGLVIQNVFCP